MTKKINGTPKSIPKRETKAPAPQPADNHSISVVAGWKATAIVMGLSFGLIGVGFILGYLTGRL